MRSLPILKIATAALAAVLLAGCLVSEEPVLDSRNGADRPLAGGEYVACEKERDGSDCTLLVVRRLDDGAYSFRAEDEEDAVILRFHRVARKAYAVQSFEGDGYIYLYGEGDDKAFSLTMMQCEDLPEKLRSRLISKGDLSTEGDGFRVCAVNRLRGLTKAAQAYHHRQNMGEGDDALILTPIADTAEE